MTNKNVIITGTSGFLGIHLANVCSAAGYEIIGIDRNPKPENIRFIKYIQSPLDDIDWEIILDKYQPFACFHLAASSSVANSIKDPFGDFSRVLPSTARLLHCIANKSPNTKFIFFSSAAVYGNPDSLPISEISIVRPISPYGVHKHVAEQMIYAISSCFKLCTINLRIFSAFGDGLKKQLFFDLHKKATIASEAGKKSIVLYGTGRESRDFIHGHDVARIALLLAEQPHESKNLVFNVGSGIETTIEDAVNTYLKVLKLNINPEFSGEIKIGDPQNWCADISKIRKLGFIPKFSLVDGLENYAKWISKLNR